MSAFPGNLITKTPITTAGGFDRDLGIEGGSASGIWTLDQAAAKKQQGLWPSPSIAKTLFAWGINTNGRLGDSTESPKSSPVQIGSTGEWAYVASGNSQCSGIKIDGTLWGWGANPFGEGGNGVTGAVNSPVQAGSLTNWGIIGAGKNTRHAIKTDGSLWGWGYNNPGQIGDNTTIDKSSPVQIGALYNWSKIRSSQSACIALKTDGTIWTWGYNASGGPLGDNTIVNKSSPVQIGSDTNWSLVNICNYTTHAIKTNGTLWGWGSNYWGALGINEAGSGTNRSSPIQIGALTNWSKIVMGDQGSVIALKTDGTMWLWGYNANGEVGDNTRINRSSPIQIGSDLWQAIGAAEDHTYAISSSGNMWAWGYNQNGAVGDNTTINRSSPVQIGSDTNWRLAISPTYKHSLALKVV